MKKSAQLRLKVACQLAVLTLPLLAADRKVTAKPTAAELAAITKRGLLLAEYDSAAWQASDAVAATHATARADDRYVAHKTAVGWTVDFGRLNRKGDKFLVVHEAVQIGTAAKFNVKSFAPPREDTEWDLTAAKGIETAMRNFGETTRPYNVAVVPAQRQSMYVYLYPAQVSAGVYPLGADARYRVTADGTKIIERRQMHKSIIESAPTREDITVEGGYHTHVLSDLPEDTDVLLVLTRQPRIPEIVVAGPYMYTISVNGKITVEDRSLPKRHTESETLDPKMGNLHSGVPIFASAPKQ